MKTITVKITARTSDDMSETLKLMEVYAISGEPLLEHKDARADGSASYEYKCEGEYEEDGIFEKDIKERGDKIADRLFHTLSDLNDRQAKKLADRIYYDCKAPIEPIHVKEKVNGLS